MRQIDSFNAAGGAGGGGWWRGMKKVGEEDEVGRREGDFFRSGTPPIL